MIPNRPGSRTFRAVTSLRKTTAPPKSSPRSSPNSYSSTWPPEPHRPSYIYISSYISSYIYSNSNSNGKVKTDVPMRKHGAAHRPENHSAMRNLMSSFARMALPTAPQTLPAMTGLTSPFATTELPAATPAFML